MQIKKPLLFIIIVLTIISCKKIDKLENPKTADIYLGGAIDKAGVTEATIWKNGEAFTLPSPTKAFSTISAIAVNGNDVYAVGSYFAGSGPIYNDVACYWKNGVFTPLHPASDYSNASAIAISGNDVYISGSVNSHAVYWKNGNLNNLSENGFLNSFTQGILVNGSEVYICGRLAGANAVTKACYWKNGIPNILSTDNSAATAIAFKGSDLYIVGNLSLKNEIIGLNTEKACYWKNGNLTMLADENGVRSFANGINFLNNDIYIVGNANAYSQQAMAAYWKNGVLTRLTDGKEGSLGNKLAFSGNTVYIVGTSKAGYATIWKNGVPTQLSQSSSSIRAIAIVKR